MAVAVERAGKPHEWGGVGGFLFCAIAFAVYAGLLGYALDRFIMSRLRES